MIGLLQTSDSSSVLKRTLLQATEPAPPTLLIKFPTIIVGFPGDSYPLLQL